MPFISGLGTTPTELIGIDLSKLEAPFPNCFVGNADAAIEHHFVDILEAKRKGVVQPDAVGDDLGGETMPLVTGTHSLSLA